MSAKFSYANILHSVGQVLDQIGVKSIAIHEEEDGLFVEGFNSDGQLQVQMRYDIASLYDLVSRVENSVPEYTAMENEGVLRRFLADQLPRGWPGQHGAAGLDFQHAVKNHLSDRLVAGVAQHPYGIAGQRPRFLQGQPQQRGIPGYRFRTQARGAAWTQNPVTVGVAAKRLQSLLFQRLEPVELHQLIGRVGAEASRPQVNDVAGRHTVLGQQRVIGHFFDSFNFSCSK